MVSARLRYYTWPFIMAISAAFPIIVGYDAYLLHIAIVCLIYACTALSWNILGGYLGQVSFGHGTFVGVGAYTSALFALRLGVSPFIGILLGGLFAAVFSIVIAFPCFRLRGAYYALAMMAFSEVMKLIVTNWIELTAGPLGLLKIPPLPSFTFIGIKVDFFGDKTPNYFILLAILYIQVLLFYKLVNSEFGLAATAIRNDQDAAEALGVNAFRIKLFACILSAFFIGMVGGFYAHFTHYVDPELVFSLATWSFLPVICSYLGGTLSILGPIIGAFILILGDELVFRRILLVFHEMLYGATIVLVIIFMPRGIMGYLKKRLGRTWG